MQAEEQINEQQGGGPPPPEGPPPPPVENVQVQQPNNNFWNGLPGGNFFAMPNLPNLNVDEDNRDAVLLAKQMTLMHQQMQQQLMQVQHLFTNTTAPMAQIANAMQALATNQQPHQAPRPIRAIGTIPATFDGSTIDAEHFWHEVTLYLTMNDAAYDTEEKCISFILGLMKRGTKAGAFAGMK